MTEHIVVIAGAGPTGMMLAAELTLAGVDVVIFERETTKDREGGSRAGGLHARTIEVLDQRGIAERFLSQGQTAQVLHFHKTKLDLSDFPTRHPYSLGIFQNRIEEIMAAWIAELPVRVYRGREVTGFAQDDSGVVPNDAAWTICPFARKRSAMPRWSSTSIVREWKPPAREPAST